MKENSSNSILTTLSFTLSVLALLASGFAVYQVQSRPSAPTSVSNVSPNPTNVAGAGSNQPTASTTASVPTANAPVSEPIQSPTSTAPVANAGIQPKQFVQPAFGSDAEVELLNVKRIQDRETGQRDIVNVQFRLRRISRDNPSPQDLSPGQITARNPDTSEAYEAADLDHSTDLILLSQVKPGTSVDAYVWLRVPEDVTTIDILIPRTQAFQSVPITN